MGTDKTERGKSKKNDRLSFFGALCRHGPSYATLGSRGRAVLGVGGLKHETPRTTNGGMFAVLCWALAGHATVAFMSVMLCRLDEVGRGGTRMCPFCRFPLLPLLHMQLRAFLVHSGCTWPPGEAAAEGVSDAHQKPQDETDGTHFHFHTGRHLGWPGLGHGTESGARLAERTGLEGGRSTQRAGRKGAGRGGATGALAHQKERQDKTSERRGARTHTHTRPLPWPGRACETALGLRQTGQAGRGDPTEISLPESVHRQGRGRRMGQGEAYS